MRKGGVEGELGRFRRNHLVPVPELASLAELNDRLAAWSVRDLDRTIVGRSETVGARLLREIDVLRSLPCAPFPTLEQSTHRVNQKSMITVRRNRYSVRSGLSAQTYQPENVQTAPASGVAIGTATLGGSVNPAGAPVQVRVEFGPTTSYGQSTAVQSLAPSETQTAFSAAVTGLPAGTLHYRAVATSDFGTFAGPDATVQIPATPPPPGNGHTSVGHAKLKGTTASVRVSCTRAAGRPASSRSG